MRDVFLNIFFRLLIDKSTAELKFGGTFVFRKPAATGSITVSVPIGLGNKGKEMLFLAKGSFYLLSFLPKSCSMGKDR